MHWVLIETGSNQPFIFATNKQRLQLAASREIRLLGEQWIADAVEAENADKSGSAVHVVKASGTGMVRVADVDTGRRIVQAVTERAITRGTGLDVWGYVHDRDDEDDPTQVAAELRNAQRQHGLVRSQRLSPLAQGLNNPFEQQCSYTGRPAAPFDSKDPDAARGLHRSAAIQGLWGRSKKARRILVDELRSRAPDGPQEQVIEDAVVSWDRLNNGHDIANNGWVGVLHADGNGIGSVFSHLVHGADDESSFLDLETRLSDDLRTRMWRIVAETIAECGRNSLIGGKPPLNWVLPIVIGGDDVTVVLHGAMAWDFTRRLIDIFASSFQEKDGPFPKVLKRIKENLTRAGNAEAAATIPDTLTLGAGLVFVKPHHPFSHAVSLAEQLATSAKRACKPHGGVDVEVLFESAVRDLDAIRASQRVGEGTEQFLRYGGPFIVTAEADDRRSIVRFETLLDQLRDSTISRSVLHSLREAIDTETTPANLRAIIQRAFEALRARRDVDRRLVTLLEADVFPNDEPTQGAGKNATGESFTRIITALDLLDVAQGTAAARNADDGTSADADAGGQASPPGSAPTSKEDVLA